VAMLVFAVVGRDPTPGMGESTSFDARVVTYANGRGAAYESTARRMAWEVRKRTSVETRLDPDAARLDEPRVFDSPFLYWSGKEGFPPLSDAEVVGLRRFVEFGGFVFVDDAKPESGAFGRDVRRELGRAFPALPIRPVPSTHTLYRAFYLLSNPVGRILGGPSVDGIDLGGRLAVILSAHDVGGAIARDNLGTWENAASDEQRELAERFVVNIVLYALCLDYKDDQVHAPFIMRRRGLGH